MQDGAGLGTIPDLDLLACVIVGKHIGVPADLYPEHIGWAAGETADPDRIRLAAPNNAPEQSKGNALYLTCMMISAAHYAFGIDV
uniref:Uncharacterized protein n=1 Tax=Rhodopseudomonas palustris (strain BisA53) TaxID=316055 RepID=Q07JA6_RHOP5